jgi:hypothetical protein
VSTTPAVLVIEYELSGENAASHLEAALDLLRQAIAVMPPLAQPFNVTVFHGDEADRVTQAALGRDCAPS